jgi:hypothetical protein
LGKDIIKMSQQIQIWNTVRYAHRNIILREACIHAVVVLESLAILM